MHVFNFEDIAVDQYTYGEPLGSAGYLTRTEGAHPPGSSDHRALST